MVDQQTDGIAQSTALIQHSVDSVKGGLSAFAADARENGGQLHAAQERLAKLEELSGDMLDRLAGCGVRIDGTVFIERAQETTRAINPAIEDGNARGEIDAGHVVDVRSVPVPAPAPVTYATAYSTPPQTQ